MRAIFRGEGVPNPEFALPDPGSDSSVPLAMDLPHGVPFPAGAYLELGYTNYEVWCVGGSGGKGGGSFRYFAWPYYIVDGVTHFHDPVLDTQTTWGGAGGGGGLHRVFGLLSELPEECAVVVGQAGAHGADGVPGDPLSSGPGYNGAPFDPVPPTSPGSVYDEPHYHNAVPPTGGVNGGVSTFNETTCQASGGKGGEPGMYWGTNASGDPVRRVRAKGGEGGAGDRTIVGGGGAGSDLVENPGEDGSWDGTIGKGGGGGRGGGYIMSGFMFPPDQPEVAYTEGGIDRQASNGGRGSFGFGDTSVYGTRGIRSELVVPISGYPGSASKPLIPGSGGGARARALPYGSYVPAYNPNGIVLIRLTKSE